MRQLIGTILLVPIKFPFPATYTNDIKILSREIHIMDIKGLCRSTCAVCRQFQSSSLFCTTMKKICEQKENNVVSLLQQGYSYNHIALRLSISKSTVRRISKSHLPGRQTLASGRPKC